MCNNIFKIVYLTISLLLLGFLASASSEIVFLATTSKIVRPNSVQKVYISGEESGSPTKCIVKISHYNLTEAVAEKSVLIEPGKTVTAFLPVKDLRFHSYNLTVTTEDSDKEKDRAILYVDRIGHSIFIQTDKPIYKPGETVQFRVIVLDREFRPLKSDTKANVSISDTSRNLIKYWKDIQIPDNGLLKKQIELSSEPNLGDWTIKVDVDNQNREHTFNVAQYVLPKFKVEVKLPSFITFNDTKIIAELNAFYTYGKSVNKGEFQVSLTEYFGYCPDCQSAKLTRTISKNDGPSFAEFDVRKDLNITRDQLYEKQFRVTAQFTESVTGLQQNGSATIQMYQYPYKISLLNPPSNYKPGFPLNLTVQVSSQDNTPISDEDPNALQISHGFSWDDADGHMNSSIPKNGLVQLSFTTPTNELININTMQIKYKELLQDIYLPNKETTPNKVYMQLYRLTNDNITDSGELKLRVKVNKNIGLLKYILLCRGEVFSVDRLPGQVAQKLEQDFTVKIPPKCNPHGKVIVFAMFPPKNDIVADSVKFDMQTALDNFLNINISSTKVEPRNNISLYLESKPKSTIALRGVDQSVLLLKKDATEIDIKAVDEIISSSESVVSRYSIWGSNTFRIFDDSGIVILTNAETDKPAASSDTDRYYYDEEDSIREFQPMPVMANFAARPMMSTPAALKAASASYSREPNVQNVMIRTEFPETWIFDEINSTDIEGGMTTFSQTVPDTITSWIITGFCINDEDGLGISLNPTKLTTFRPFFISLNVPYSVVKGEVFALQVLVHNYLETELQVEVNVDNPSGMFEFIEDKSSADKETLTKTIAVPSSQVVSVSFLVIPTTFGIKKLNIKAVSPLAGDGVSRPLIIKPPGQKQIGNEAVLVDLRSGEKSFTANLSAQFPTSRVAGADTIKLTLIGDMLGSTISNLDKLLQLPTGCGEQNMLNFVVDIVVLNYLKSIGSLTPAIRQKALGYLEKGYQRQLTYLRYDGSFSAFGNSDEFGSTWLTAFVVRSFIQAMPFITVDENVISKSLSYLAERQQPYGGFEELGRVHDEELLGGSGSGALAMSSYTLLAFIEASKSLSKFNYSSVVSNGLGYVSNKNDVANNTYAMTLIAYTLAIADHPKKEIFFNAMESFAKRKGDLQFWEQKKVESNSSTNATITPYRNKYYYLPWYHETKPATVEMTAYALLTTLMQNKITESLPIARWLTSQRNSQGGFKSTQDTVVGVTALAKFGLATRTKDSNLKINIDYQGGEKVMTIENNNDMELQEMVLPPEAHWIQLTATGKGSGLAQLSWSYYVEMANATSAFDLTIRTKDSGSPKNLWLNVCGAYKYSGKSNMVIMEVGLPTGYTFETERLDAIKNSDVLRYETEDANTKLIIYYNQMTPDEICVDLFAFLTHPVAKQAPAQVTMYDYYDTTKQATASYDPPKITICDICEYDKTCKIENCV